MPKDTETSEAITRFQLAGRTFVIIEESAYQQLLAVAEGKATPELLDGLLPWASAAKKNIDRFAIGRRIVDRRRQLGLTQADLARRAGIRAETLNRIERGRALPDFSTIKALAVAIRDAGQAPGKRARKKED